MDSTVLDCRQCLQEIPPSHDSETEDYVSHYCGLECYAAWQQQQADGEPPLLHTPAVA